MPNNIGIIRPLKTGGCSICTASEENVGKKKCQHMLSDAIITVLPKQAGSNLRVINIDAFEDSNATNISIAATTSQIKTYISNLSNSLSDEERNSILEVLRAEL